MLLFYQLPILEALQAVPVPISVHGWLQSGGLWNPGIKRFLLYLQCKVPPAPVLPAKALWSHPPDFLPDTFQIQLSLLLSVPVFLQDSYFPAFYCSNSTMAYGFCASSASDTRYILSSAYTNGNTLSPNTAAFRYSARILWILKFSGR